MLKLTLCFFLRDLLFAYKIMANFCSVERSTVKFLISTLVLAGRLLIISPTAGAVNCPIYWRIEGTAPSFQLVFLELFKNNQWLENCLYPNRQNLDVKDVLLR